MTIKQTDEYRFMQEDSTRFGQQQTVSGAPKSYFELRMMLLVEILKLHGTHRTGP